MKTNNKKRTYKFRIRFYGQTTAVLLNWLQLALAGIEHEEDVISFNEVKLSEMSPKMRSFAPDDVMEVGFTDRMSKVLKKKLTNSEFKDFVDEFKKYPGFTLKKHKETGLILINIDFTKEGES